LVNSQRSFFRNASCVINLLQRLSIIAEASDRGVTKLSGSAVLLLVKLGCPEVSVFHDRCWSYYRRRWRCMLVRGAFYSRCVIFPLCSRAINLQI